MAFAEKSFFQVATTSSATVYTAPADTWTQVLSLRVTNKSTATYTFTMMLYDASSATSFELNKDLTIPAKATVDLTAGRLVLEPGDYITIQSSSTNAMVLAGSVAERT